VSEPLLSVDSVTVGYGGLVAVRDVSFEVMPGEVVALLGANGAGKTSTLRAITGLERTRGGRIVFDRNDITRSGTDATARLGVAHVPSGRGIFRRLSVEENLRMALYAVGEDRTSIASARLAEMYERFPVLAERLAQAAGTMSGGQQQQLAVARALVQAPRLLLVDEMSMGLSPTLVAELFEIVAGIKTAGVAVVLVEQFVHQALTVADRAVVLEQGRVVADQATAELSNADVAAAYLGGSHDANTLLVPPPPPDAREGVRIDLPGREVRRLEHLAAARHVTLGQLVETMLRDPGLDGQEADHVVEERSS
jgi:branched-chain amino acid transport system ATP-binding protein